MVTTWAAYTFAALLGYLLGSFPTGYLVGRARGIDIRQHGSKNIGATNVVRVLGKRPGFLVFAVDALKGLLAVGVGYALGRRLLLPGGLPELAVAPSSQLNLMAVVAAVACLLGHSFPVWLNFRGGKGIATSAGILLGLMPVAVGFGVAAWAATFFALRYVSLASLVAAVTLPVTVAVLWHVGRADGSLFTFSVLAASLAGWRHRSNVQRLLAGTEPRFEKKGTKVES